MSEPQNLDPSVWRLGGWRKMSQVPSFRAPGLLWGSAGMGGDWRTGPLSGTVGVCGRSGLDEVIVTFAKQVRLQGCRLNWSEGEVGAIKRCSYK